MSYVLHTVGLFTLSGELPPIERPGEKELTISNRSFYFKKKM